MTNQPLVCRLRKKMHGRAAPLPTAGEVELENISGETLEIEVQTSPLQYLNLVVTNGEGKVVSEWHYGHGFSPLAEPFVFRLQSGEKHSFPVSLLGNVPPQKQQAGQYLVQAVFETKGFKAESEPLPIHLRPQSDEREPAPGVLPSSSPPSIPNDSSTPNVA